MLGFWDLGFGPEYVCWLRRGFWLRKGLVVKIMSAELKPAGLYKQKGIVICLVSEQVGLSPSSTDMQTSIHTDNSRTPPI